MSQNNYDQAPSCEQVRDSFQDYLDGAMPKTRSLELYLHMRDCDSCRAQLEQTKLVYELLDNLPEAAVPVDFDRKILMSVPYAAYRAMEPLRRERVPVFLEEDFLPAPVRSLPVRIAGLALAGLGGTGLAAGWLPEFSTLLVAVGLFPEVLLRMQSLARRIALARSESQAG